jgi:hypothetical protein
VRLMLEVGDVTDLLCDLGHALRTAP